MHIINAAAKINGAVYCGSEWRGHGFEEGHGALAQTQDTVAKVRERLLLKGPLRCSSVWGFASCLIRMGIAEWKRG